MLESNQKILEDLKLNGGNASAVRVDLNLWDHVDEFPKDDLMTAIKMHKWKYEDFDFEMERLFRNVLPDFMLDIFFDVKEFRSNSRNELTSSAETYSKIMGYPIETQDDKAYCQYQYSFSKYYENSMLNKPTQTI